MPPRPGLVPPRHASRLHVWLRDGVEIFLGTSLREVARYNLSASFIRPRPADRYRNASEIAEARQYEAGHRSQEFVGAA